jgi:hypothetical protein
VPRSFRLLLVLLAALTLTAPPAAAGTYTVRQCDYATGNGFHDFRWQASGSPAVIQNPGSGCGEFGLAARNGNVGVEQTYPSGGYGGWFAYAPPGTVFTHFSGAFGVLAGCCINGMATYAEATEISSGGGRRSFLFQGNLGNDTWYAPSSLQGPVGRSWDASSSGFAAQHVAFYLRCGPGFSCYQKPTGDLRMRARSFHFTLRDDVAPSVGAGGGTLLAGGWLRGSRTLGFTASDAGGGIVDVSAAFDNGTALSAPSGCTTIAGHYVQLQPCPLGRSGAWTVDTSKLPDGVRTLVVRAHDAGGSGAQQIHTVRVDNGAPATPIAAAPIGGGAWRSLNGFAIGWTNPGGQHAPIALARFTACRAGGGGGECVSGERPVDGLALAGGIVLPHAGEWDLRVWLEDAAGNADPQSASPPQRVRFDPDPPALRFLPVDPAAPSQLVVDVDDMSGVAGAAVELRATGRERWVGLPTTVHGSRVTAEIDDLRLAAGTYDVRARAVDAAGNEGVALGGERTLPVRAPTRLQAEIVKRVPRARLGCRPIRAAACRRKVTVRRAAVSARHGATVVVRARLRTGAGRPLAARAVGVSLVSADRTIRLADRVTDSAGNVALPLRARRSAVVKLGFGGDRGALPSARRLRIDVPAPVTFATARRAVAGRPVLFHGRVRGGSIPRGGKLVEIQAHFRGRWRTISTVRSRGGGRWRFAYAFRGAGRAATYRLRARVPAEAGYPFAHGTSRAARVTVRGR